MSPTDGKRIARTARRACTRWAATGNAVLLAVASTTAGRFDWRDVLLRGAFERWPPWRGAPWRCPPWRDCDWRDCDWPAGRPLVSEPPWRRRWPSLLRVPRPAVLGVSPVRFSRSADRDDAGRSVRGALGCRSAARMLEEKAPTEKTPVVKASSRELGRAED